MKTIFMAKQIVLFMACLFVANASLKAQNEEIVSKAKTTVFVEKMQNDGDDQHKAVRNAVSNGLTKSGRIVVIDAESEKYARLEDMRRNSDNVTSGQELIADRLGAVVRLGAQYYILVSVDNINTHSEKSGNNWIAKCNIMLTLKLIDPSESKVISTEQMKFLGTDSKDNHDEAFNSALRDITSTGLGGIFSNPLTQFIDRNFPIIGQILEIDQSKKDNAVTVYINAGSANGVSKGTKFEVFKSKTVAGRIAETKIAEVEAQEVQGEDLTLCKVIKAGDQIFSEFNGGATLKVKSRPKKSFLGSL